MLKCTDSGSEAWGFLYQILRYTSASYIYYDGVAEETVGPVSLRSSSLPADLLQKLFQLPVAIMRPYVQTNCKYAIANLPSCLS